MSPDTLYQFEPRITAAAVAALKQRGVAQAHDNRETVERTAPLIALEASGFQRASTHMDFAKNGRPFYNHFSGQVRFIITTKRDATGPALHDRWLGTVRALCDLPAQALVIEGYRIIRLQESSGTLTYLNEGERDRSELVYDVELSIPGAFMDYSASA